MNILTILFETPVNILCKGFPSLDKNLHLAYKNIPQIWCYAEYFFSKVLTCLGVKFLIPMPDVDFLRSAFDSYKFIALKENSLFNKRIFKPCIECSSPGNCLFPLNKQSG